jgi:7,8-dihydroneopterin aldolase/epimerase/oxygenase
VGKIIFEDIEFYAYHGHYAEENQIGGKFLVNLEIDADIEIAGFTDNLNDTFDYQQAYKIVDEEMQINSSLLENLASRIIDRLLISSDKIHSVKIKVSKMNPPFGGNVKAVSVELMRKKEE